MKGSGDKTLQKDKMTFSSMFFLLIFFPAMVLLYQISIRINETLAKVVLTFASLIFYAWACLNDVFKLMAFILVLYLAGQTIFFIRHNSKVKPIILLLVIMMLVLVLGIYKYYDVIINGVNDWIGVGIQEKGLIAPIGISYIIFSAISYIVDVYRGDKEPGRILDVALYISFFPKVTSGPITLYKDFDATCFKINNNVNQYLDGINRIILGLAKKVILADYFGGAIAEMSEHSVDIPTLILTIVLYGLQLYYDFSGYSDIAIGLSKLFGIELQENFNFPYLCTSITDFWRRWHMSLGNFMKEYVYIPLGGNRKGKKRTLLNLFIIFLITGVWHGAGLNYLIWGTMHGICRVLEKAIEKCKWYIKVPNCMKWVITTVIVFALWQLFRFTTISECVEYFNSASMNTDNLIFTYQYYLNRKMICMLLVGILGATLVGTSVVQQQIKKWNETKCGIVCNQIIIYVIFAIDLIVMANSTYSPFMYFRY